MEDEKLEPLVFNIEKDTVDNNNYRVVIYTGKFQLVLMSLKPYEEIGMEIHKVDQFFRVEKGKGELIIIDPNNFLSAIERHFVGILLCLRNPNEKEKRERFIKFAKEKWDYEGLGVIVGLNNDGRI